VIPVPRLIARVAGAVAVLVAVGGLSGCIAEDPGFVAVRLVDGQLVMLLARCPDFQLDAVSVYLEDTSSASNAHDLVTRSLKRTGAEVPTSFRFFGRPPKGWEVVGDQLPELQPGKQYGATGSAPTGFSGTMRFTLADLARLAPDEVLVGVNYLTKKMTEQEFRENAQGDCADMAPTPVPTGFPPT
jgi:hypothetical protein